MAPPTPVDKTIRTRSSSANDMQSIEEKLDLILSQNTQIKRDSDVMKKDINLIKEDNRYFKEEINKALEFHSAQLNEFKEDLSVAKNKVSEQGGEIDSLKGQNRLLKQEVTLLKKKLNSNTQYSRCNCLEIQGVPESKTENVVDLVLAVSEFLGFKMHPTMIDAAHRLAPIPGRSGPRNIIVKFCRRFDMEQVRRLAIKKKGFSASNLGLSTDHTVYVNLSMTRETRILWMDARKLKEDLNFKFVWMTAAGKIFLRKTEKAPAILIEDQSDLQRLRSTPGPGPVKKTAPGSSLKTATTTSTDGQ